MNWWILKRQIHQSWLISILCLSLFIGIFLAQYFNLSSIYLVIASAVFIFICFWRRYIYLIPFLIIGGFLFGMWRGSVDQDALAKFKPFYNKSVSVIGYVKDDIDVGTASQIIIRLDSLIINGVNLPGNLWITASENDIKRGDKLMINGKLQPGFGNFAGIMYRANINEIIHPKPGDIARVARDWFADLVRNSIPEPESSLGIGFLVGQRRSLPGDLEKSLQLAGLTHIVVASGYNLTILVRLSRRLFTKVSKYLSALSASLMIFSFIAITGMSPSMSRAGLVSGLSLAAWYYGRRFHPIVLLSVAIAITVVINPSYAWGDLGWQLSFAAFAGVMILAPLASRYLFGDNKPGAVSQILVETVSAQIVTAPILIAGFGQISNVAIISNILILPFVPIAMLLTFIAGIGSFILPFLALLIGLPATWLLHYMINVADVLSGLPWAVSNVRFGWPEMLICYLVIFFVCFYMWRITKYNLRESSLVE